ncbi:MAG TPA: hypothetical protein VJ652_08515 [Noviherbaspirillum sp.]|nr:hypothetical protein [Noviherbaspirillum sp.]
MSINVDAATLTLLILLALVVIGVAVYALRVRQRGRREQDSIAAIRAAILDYFRRSGVDVAVGCARLPGGTGFTAVVESEPMKRFRLSHIIEMTLREHVRKTSGLELDKVYWRFPVKQVADAVAKPTGAQEGAADAKKADEFSDEYINEGLENYRHIPKPEVEELPWEQFEQVTGPKKSDA